MVAELKTCPTVGDFWTKICYNVKQKEHSKIKILPYKA
jgi:hypothetical protein